MLPAAVEKFAFGLAAMALYLSHRIPPVVLAFGLIDLGLGVLFLEAFRRTAPAPA